MLREIPVAGIRVDSCYSWLPKKGTIPNPGTACTAHDRQPGTGLRNQGRPPAASNPSLCAQPLRGNSPAPPSFELLVIRHFHQRCSLTTNHTNWTNAAGTWRRRKYSCLFVPFVVAKKELSPNPGAPCAAREHHAGRRIENQGRPPAASNSSLCVATASRYQYCSAVSRASDFVIPSSLGISSFVLLRRVPRVGRLRASNPSLCVATASR